jgi:hypothetical protein
MRASRRVFQLAVFFVGMMTASHANAASRTFAFTLPPMVTLDGQAALKAEYNMMWGGLSLEAISIVEQEGLRDDEIKKTGDSRKFKGGELALFYANYFNPAMMSGGYWAVGAGYRAVQSTWRRNAADLGLSNSDLADADGKVTQQLEGQGATGHVRAGYRWVAESIPFVFGIYGGVRHFAAQFDNAETDQNLSQASEDELQSIARRNATGLEAALEIGMAF